MVRDVLAAQRLLVLERLALVGLLLGAEEDWPRAFESIVGTFVPRIGSIRRRKSSQ
jgi:hypothetical protein